MIDPDLKYSEILQQNRLMADTRAEPGYNVAVLGNITTAQLTEILEYTVRSSGIAITVTQGDYDNIVQDAEKFRDADLVIIFWEACNIIDGLQYKIDLLDDAAIAGIIDRIQSELDMVKLQLKDTSLVIVNRFSAAQFSSLSPVESRLDRLAARLNTALETDLPGNFKVIDTDTILSHVGIDNGINLRNYYSSKALYSVEFFKAYSAHVLPLIRSAAGQARKALIFDCDNTLWKGILGEDGYEGIDMSPDSKTGVIYRECQAIAKNLVNQGVLLGVCSKNNYDDVQEVLVRHPDMLLRMEDFSVLKINWEDKASNLQQIASELNIGLDSIVFVDDSDFEIDLVRKQLPDVYTFHVPPRLYQYPGLLRSMTGLFYNLSISSEDRNKSQQYAQQAKRAASKSEFSSIDDYLASLGIAISIYIDNRAHLARASQLCRKTNQFNLTTVRHSESDIQRFLESGNSFVVSVDVSDKFGDSGITALCIVILDHEKGCADIDTFLMSCRIIGRNIEFAIMDQLIDLLKNMSISTVTGKYIQTIKNGQVKNFYSDCSFAVVETAGKNTSFTLDINKYRQHNVNNIEVIYEPGS